MRVDSGKKGPGRTKTGLITGTLQVEEGNPRGFQFDQYGRFVTVS